MTALARITNITRSFLAFWREAGALSPSERLRAWQERYYLPNQEILDLYFSRWGRREQLEAALDRLSIVSDTIANRDARLQKDLDECAARVCQILALPPTPLNVVALVGVGDSNGWAYLFRGAPTLFLALECDYPSGLAWRVLLAHESAHVLHFWSLASAHPEAVPGLLADMDRLLTHIGLSCFSEGLATVVSRGAHPDVDEAQMYWTRGGAEAGAWVRRCRAMASRLYQEVLDSADGAGDDERYRQYFWGRPDMGVGLDLPARSGYFVGVRVVERLLNQGWDLPALARLLPDTVTGLVKDTLRGLVADTR